MRLLKTIIYLLLLLWGMEIHAQILQQKVEDRAVWLTTLNGLDWPRTKAVSPKSMEKQKQELISILDQYQALHLNQVLIQTRVRGSMIYPSDLEGWDPCLTGTPGKDPGYDPLQFAIEECHKRGMELHCWMVTIPSGNVDVHTKLGNKSVTRTHPELCKKVKKYWYLDPGNPETPAYLARVCEEVTRKYDIDGIHLDFIRYPENSADIVDRNSYRRYGRGENKAQWRRNNITACVRAIYNAVKGIKPWVKVTCAPLGKYRDTDRYSSTGWNGYNKVYQECQLWLKQGIMDAVYPMLYYRGNHFYPFVHDWKENSNGRPIIPGLGIYFLHPHEGNWTLADVQRQMNYSRIQGLGVAHYRSKFLTDNTKGLYTWCQDVYYPYPSLTTPMTWQCQDAPLPPQQLHIQEEGKQTHIQWSAVPDSQTGTYVTYNVYRSESNLVNINRPENLVAARLLVPQYIDLTEGRPYHYAITAVNRYGIESEPLRSNTASALTFEGVSYALGTLHLPESASGTVVEIRDRFETPVLTVPFARSIDVRNLPRGSYHVVVLHGTTSQNQGFFFK